MTSSLWTEKYRPKKYTDLIFKNDLHHEALKWLKNFPKYGRVILFNGPPGIGKTSLAHILANIFNYNIVEFNASNDTDYVEKILDINGTINSKKNLILIDEIDNNPTLAINKIISAKLPYPIILTANEITLKEVYTLNFKRPEVHEVKEAIDKICYSESIFVDTSIMSNIIDRSGCDFRSVINFLQVSGSNVLTSKNTRQIEKIIPANQYKSAEIILSKYVPWKNYEELYSFPVAKMCYNSFLTSNNSLKSIFDVYESVSISDILPERYKFITLYKYNNCNSRNATIQKGEHVKTAKFNFLNEDVMPFFKKYDLKNKDKKKLNHLKGIVKKYKIKDIAVEDIETFLPQPKISSQKFKYKYKHGSSSAVKRDIKVKDLLSM